MKRPAFLFILAVLCAWIAGCASTQQARFYTLSPAAIPAEKATSCSISVGPVSIPAVVDRPQFVMRSGPHQVSVDEFNRWASPLQGEIATAIAGNLATELGTSSVTLFPQSTAADATYRVIVDVLHFDSTPNAAKLDALWTVRSKKESRTGRTTFEEPVKGGAGDYAALVAAHSAGIGRLSANIAAAIRDLDRKSE